MSKDYTEIPEPPGWPILGHVLDIDPTYPLSTWIRYADQYGS